MARRNADELERERQNHRAAIESAFDEEEDPLAPYERFVKWIIDNYELDDPDSGLLDLLEETTMQFKDDDAYKGNRMYLNLWIMYANLVEDSATVLAFLVENGIGTSFCILYEEYAKVLEKDGMQSEAERIYRLGIERRARPFEKLKRLYNDFMERHGLSSTPSPKPELPSKKISSSQSRQTSQASSSKEPSRKETSRKESSRAKEEIPPDGYARMKGPPVAGKRREKLRADISLLMTPDGVEYCAAEARARSLGLLGKKWASLLAPPQPQGNQRPTILRVNFGEGTKTMSYGNTRRKSMLTAEPTVTINTKEALADVFGMFNSPEKTARSAKIPGSKHAPVKKVEPLTPMLRAAVVDRDKTPAPANRDENAIINKTPGSTFRPFVDDPDVRKENSKSALTPFKPFVDPEASKTPFKPFVDPQPAGKTSLITPDPKRRVLSVKEIATPTTAPRGASNENPPNALRARSAKPNAEDGIGLGISRVFTPKPTKDVFVAPERDVLSPVPPTQPKANSSPVEEESNPVPAPFRVFSRPTPHAENAFIPKRTAAFTPLVEPPSKVESPPPPPSFTPSFVFTERAMSKAPVFPSDSEREDELSPDQEYEDEEAPDASSPSEELPLDYDDYYEEDPGLDHEPQHIPFGGRFGQFNVMTPITERTFEMTASTRFLDTPRDHSPYLRHEQGAMLAAERLAAELREEEEREQALSRPRDSLDGQNLRTTDGEERESCFASDNDEQPALPAMDSIEEKIGSLSLVDALSLKSSFKPPNPCNPFDPPIVKTLLSLILTDGGYHNLMDREVNHLEDLRKFAHKRRKMSGNTSATLVLDPDQTFPLTLAGRRFEVGTKLGEGGFGSVFAARDSAGKGSRRNNDSDDEEDDEDASAMVALKVVRPRNLWEYHVLRRLHASIPSHLRRSVVIPYDLYAYRDESFLVLELSPQGTLLDIVNRAVEAGVSQQGACLDEMLVTFFTIELLRLLEGMHSLGFIHGDLKIDNCLVRLESVPGGSAAWSNVYQPSGQGGWSYKGVKVIDFGRTIDTRLFPSGQTFIAEWEVDARDCPEMREDRPWTFQPDYFGLAGIVYCMLFGKYLETSSITRTSAADGRFKIATALKRYWQTEMWTKLFDILLNPLLIRPGGDMPLCDELRQVRGEMEKWLEANSNRVANTLKGLLKKIERAML